MIIVIVKLIQYKKSSVIFESLFCNLREIISLYTQCMNSLTDIWLQRLEILDIAFQPILNMHTGRLYAVEALLRRVQDVGFNTIHELFDTAFKENMLYSLDLALRKKALIKFTTIEGYETIKLFYNLDNRLFSMPDFKTGNTQELLEKLNLKKENLCFEISERHEFDSDANLERLVSHYKDGGFSVAIDDFGVGYSGYKLLYHFTPDVIKIDRFFLASIEKDMKKKTMVRSITQLAIQLGVKVIAEGVETKAELLTCKEIGCHLVQGYYVQYPTCDTNEIVEVYADIKKLFKQEKRQKLTAIDPYIQKIEPLSCSAKAADVLEFFQNNVKREVLPMVDDHGEPVGVIEERAVKQYLFSPYGHSLFLNNANETTKVKSIVKHYPVIDVNANIDVIIELYTQNMDGLGVIITKDTKYYGFLDTLSMVGMMNEQNLINARDQNPLTKLPGNKKIDDFVMHSLSSEKSYILCYFDLDNFKPFNDLYGFRNGDRVLQLFADILKRSLPKSYFKGHIGGDDFFIAVECKHKCESYIKEIIDVVKQFKYEVKAFYTLQDRDNGYIMSINRDDETKKFKLLTVSASVIQLDTYSKTRSVQRLNSLFSEQKKMAKSMPNHVSMSCLL